jgi:hypothetical protein
MVAACEGTFNVRYEVALGMNRGSLAAGGECCQCQGVEDSHLGLGCSSTDFPLPPTGTQSEEASQSAWL